MLLAENILPQGKMMVYVGEYYFYKGLLISDPSYQNLGERDVIPVSMWVESICQNGEVYCRETQKNIKTVVLTSVEGIEYIPMQKKDTNQIIYKTLKLGLFNRYLKSQVSVTKDGEELFKCRCTHYFTV